MNGGDRRNLGGRSTRGRVRILRGGDGGDGKKKKGEHEFGRDQSGSFHFSIPISTLAFVILNTEKGARSSSPGQIGSKVRGFWLKSNASLMFFAEASRVLSAFSPKRVSMNFKIEVWSFVWLSTYPLFA